MSNPRSEAPLRLRVTEDQIQELVHAFYAKVREDPELGPVFDGRIEDRWDPHLQKMCDFWSSILLGTARYTGHPHLVHTQIEGITSANFDRWIEIFEATAHEVLEEALATDVVGRSKRMRLVLERASVGAGSGGATTSGPSHR